jgi:hypothetical protein
VYVRVIRRMGFSVFMNFSKNSENRLLTLSWPSVRPINLSIRPHGKTLRHWMDFHVRLKFEYFFRKSIENVHVSRQYDKNGGYFT